MSSNKTKINLIKVFGMTNQLISEDLTRIERERDLDLGHEVNSTDSEENSYYSQFDESVRKEAAEMAQHYQLFYCLEKSIRELIYETLEESEGPSWWHSSRINSNLQGDVKKRIDREQDSGMTLRSNDPLDFTNFGELYIIINSNWDLFGGILNSSKAVGKIMGSLNSLRGPIAHCGKLAEDEELRLRLSLRDWFRQME